MSWCGGGLISPTPGVEYRTLAIQGQTLWPGSCPPSPGLAPWAILICSSSALTRYSLVTPNRPEATCLIALFLLSPLGKRLVPLGVLAPFAGVRLAAHPVHGDRQGLVRLGRDRAVAHGAGREPLDDRLDRLDLLDRHRLRSCPSRNVEQAAQRAEPLVLVVDQPGVLLEDVVPARLRGVLEPEDGLGVEQVELAVAAPLVLAPLEQPGRPRRRGSKRRGDDDRASRAAISSRPTPPTRDAVLSK